MIRGFRNLPVGVKLAATLVAAVLVTALFLTLVEHVLVRRSLETQASHHQQHYLNALTNLVGMLSERVLDPQNAISEAVHQLEAGMDVENALKVYGLTPEGQVILPPEAAQSALPPPKVLAGMIRQGRGHLDMELGGRRAWLYFDRPPDMRLVLVVQGSYEYLVSRALTEFMTWSWAAALVVAVLLALAGVLVSRRELVDPLVQLAREGERVAGGDLSPPAIFRDRRDEIGRLSVALNQMTLAVAEMIQKDQASQARFQRVFRDNRDGIVIVDQQRVISEVNPAAVKMFGYATPEEMLALGTTGSLFFKQPDREYYLELLKDQGFVKDYPATLVRKDGSQFQALITATARGEDIGFAMFRDVTQMYAAQRALMESEDRYRRLLENAPDLVYRWSFAKDNFDYLSPAVAAITGYQPREVMRSPYILRDTIDPEFKDRVVGSWRSLAKGEMEGGLALEYKLRTKDGGERWIRERVQVVKDAKGEPLALEGLATDITVSKKLEQALIQGQQMVEATVQGLPVAVMVIDREHKVVHWNQAMSALTGVPARERVGTSLQWNPFYPHPRPVLADLLLDGKWDEIEELYGKKGFKHSSLAEGGVEGEQYFENLGGRPRQIYFWAAPIRDQDGKVRRAVETLIDISEQRKLEDELRRLSVTDNLTGLYNRRFMYASLKREVESARRYGHPLSLLLLDLDHFKNYNDRYGHLEGDQVLARSAQLLRDTVRTMDLACRYGGEELVVVLPSTDIHEASHVAERIRAGIEGLKFSPELPGRGKAAAGITASVGVAQLEEGMGPDELINLADQAMYLAKRQGRNLVALYTKESGLEVVETPGRSESS